LIVGGREKDKRRQEQDRKHQKPQGQETHIQLEQNEASFFKKLQKMLLPQSSRSKKELEKSKKRNGSILAFVRTSSTGRTV
jgi:hypothetical protein